MNIEELLNPRIVELMEADKEGRVVILPNEAEEQRLAVESALRIAFDIKLFDWQVAYIWGDSSYLMPGRATGKTLAQIIKLCVSEGSPIVLPLTEMPRVEFTGIPEHYHNYRWFRGEVERIYRALGTFRVPGLRKIYFSYKEAYEDGLRGGEK